MSLYNRITFLYLGLSLVITSCSPFYNGDEFTETATSTTIPTLADTNDAPTSMVVTPTPSKSPARVPTLDVDQGYILLQSLMQVGPDCQFPCWGEITPGVTSITEAERIIQPLFSMLYGGPISDYKGHQFASAGGGRSFMFGDVEVSFILGWWFNQGNDTVKKLHIKAFAYQESGGERVNVYGAESYNQIFNAYNLQGILSIYGVPSEVLTFAWVYNHNDKPFPNPEEFQLILLYLDKGIFVEYKMPLTRIGNDKGMACPSEAFFEIWLVPPETSGFYQELWSSYTTGSSDFTDRQSVEESTQMTLGEFYQAFLTSENQCLEIPLSIWPQH